MGGDGHFHLSGFDPDMLSASFHYTRLLMHRMTGIRPPQTTGIKIPEFKVVDETDDYIIIDKPALLLVHPTKPNGATTLWTQLRQLLAFEIASGGQVSIVNRLDRETSGIVLVAKTTTAAREFGLLMQSRRLSKEYHAIVWGWPDWETTSVDGPLVRQGEIVTSKVYLKQMIDPCGAEAVTKFHLVKRF